MDKKLLFILIAFFLILILIGSNLFNGIQSLLGNASVSITASTFYRNKDHVSQFKIYKDNLYTYEFNQVNQPNGIVNYLFTFKKYIPSIFTNLQLNWNNSLSRVDQSINQVYYSRPDELIAVNENNFLMSRTGYNSVNSSNTLELYAIGKAGVLWIYNNFEGKYSNSGYKFLLSTVQAVAISTGFLISFLSYYINNQNFIADYEVITILDNGFISPVTSDAIIYPIDTFGPHFNPSLLPSTMIGPFYKDIETIEFGLVTPSYQSIISSNSQVNIYDYDINSKVTSSAKNRETEFLDQIKLIMNNSTSSTFLPRFIMPYSDGFLILGPQRTSSNYMSYDIWSNNGIVATINAFSITAQPGYNYFSLSPLERNSNAYTIVPVIENKNILIFGIPVVRIFNVLYLPSLCVLNLNSPKSTLEFYTIDTAASIYPVHYESMTHILRNNPVFVEMGYQNEIANFIITSINIVATNFAAKLNQADPTIFVIIFATIFSLPIIPIYQKWLNKNKNHIIVKKDLYPENVKTDKQNDQIEL